MPVFGYKNLTDISVNVIECRYISNEYYMHWLNYKYGYYNMTVYSDNVLNFGYVFLKENIWDLEYLVHMNYEGIKNATYNLLYNKAISEQRDGLIGKLVE